ncbi:MAG: hypothetical protein RMK32_02935 [Anaerolineae bacterium]|nr:hypothetical protein [Thermoflexus sp.]MDW8064572.1 hypothetical protein [Anaerolineae bacterium]
MLLYRVLSSFWVMTVIISVSCASRLSLSPVSSSASSLSPLSPVKDSVSVSPLSLPDVRSPTIYRIDANLEAAAPRPEDFPFMRALYALRTEIQDSMSRGIELRYPAQEDRFRPFIKGWAVELRIFFDVNSAREAYIDRLHSLEGSLQSLVTSADQAYLSVRASAEPGDEKIWVQEAAFWKGNLVGYLLVKWSELLDKQFFEERISLIVQRLERP